MKNVLKRKPDQSTKVEQLSKEMLQGTDTVKFSMNIPRALHREFRKKCFLSDVDMKDILLEAIRKYVNT